MHSSLVKISICSLALLLTGCLSVGFPQVTAIKKQVTTQRTPIDEFTWLMTFGDYVSEMVVVNINQRQVFANKQDEALLFDGQNIIRMTPLANAARELRMKDIAQTPTIIRQVLVNNQLFETLTCDPWVDTVAGNRMQRCQGVNTYTTKHVFAAGKLVEITQDIPYYNQTLTLLKK